MKTCLVTGASSGLGLETSLALARGGARVILLCRDRQRGEAARAAVVRERGKTAGFAADRERGGDDVDLILADLASLESVRNAAREVRARFDRLDALINNAGVYRDRREITVDGFERTQAVNHLGHFLLTELLRDSLERARGRVVNVTSDAHRAGRPDRESLERVMRGEVDYIGLRAYADSKLMNVLFTFELARRWRDAGVTANAIHPGLLATRFWHGNEGILSRLMRRMGPLLRSAGKAAKQVARLAMDPEFDGVTGRYYSRKREKKAAPAAYDPELAAELWRLSEKLTRSK